MTNEKLRECPSCAMEVDAEADECPVCGYEYPSNRAGVGAAAWLMAALLVLPLLWLLFELL
ncbi:MAG: zinc ribbon domain-containing protein [Rhodothermales bacterium]|nr:zinc ribbon domain-containing protein [Rhodothermales bacterium]